MATPAGPAALGRPLPLVIQGGMGVAISDWRLARAVSRTGQLGVVSGTALDVVVARRLQDGDVGGHVRRALDHFPVPAMAERIRDRYFRADGRPAGKPYIPVPKLGLTQSSRAQELSVVANFVEVWLAKQGHDGLVGINYLEKVQLSTPSAAYGAMLAGVDYVLMGAGIPAEIPQLLDRLAEHAPARISLHVDGGTRPYSVDIDPAELTGTALTGTEQTGTALAPLHRPAFLAIISADVLAAYLTREPATRPDGFVIEGPSAGGHNAPPRGRLQLDDDGQPVFGPRDHADLAKMRAIGLPFWLAGGFGTPDRVAEAVAAGAAGVQVGTLFALCAESGMTPAVRQPMVDQLVDGRLTVRTDPLASPTGFPFKVVSLPGTLSDPALSAARPRLCDLGYLRVPFERSPGRVGYRCPAEPVAEFVRKGGSAEATEGRTCLCNALTATAGLGQTRKDGYQELPVATLGADLAGAAALAELEPSGWTAERAVRFLVTAPA